LNKNNTSLFWFRRDLRLADNKGLFEACNQNEKVILLFIFDDNILSKLQDKDDKRVWFIWECLQSLRTQLKKIHCDILILKGKPEKIFPKLIKEYAISSIYCNEDYEPACIKRDQKIERLALDHQCSFQSFKDQVIFKGNEVLKKDNTAYKVFTPYKKVWLEKLEPKDLVNHKPNLKKLFFKDSSDQTTIKNYNEIGFQEPQSHFKGGESNAKSLFKSFLSRINNYKQERDFIYKNSNSHLSPYIRFGCISIRELLRKSYFIDNEGAHTWVSELIWREFYQMILFNYPEVIDHEFTIKYRSINWIGDKDNLIKWKEGKTGFPIIDAAMIHFAKTGIMHNRLRMIVASFLTKDLLINWREGEKYFAQKLLDFDLASNNGGWQWSASTGCDAQPYFRVFNPTTQSKRFDPNGEFIKSHLPMLKDYPVKHIHEPNLAPMEIQKNVDCIIGQHYPEPIVEHKQQRLLAIEMFKKSFN
jgi:deoxyribodipyrimidine photo-lyase